jgi:tRNA(Arg) A34 adenosine deaminase TadA
MKLEDSFTIALPAWCLELAAELPDHLPDPLDRMRLAIELSRRNVESGSGGPFGAVVARIDDGRLLALGVNRVEPAHCSSAHAEIVALSLAQARLGSWNLSEAGGLELATSCEPCAMCLGAIPWSGVRRVLCAATKADAEQAGFDEGARDPDWAAALARRGIELDTGIERETARAVLLDYRDQGARIYNP